MTTTSLASVKRAATHVRRADAAETCVLFSPSAAHINHGWLCGAALAVRLPAHRRRGRGGESPCR